MVPAWMLLNAIQGHTVVRKWKLWWKLFFFKCFDICWYGKGLKFKGDKCRVFLGGGGGWWMQIDWWLTHSFFFKASAFSFFMIVFIELYSFKLQHLWPSYRVTRAWEKKFSAFIFCQVFQWFDYHFVLHAGHMITLLEWFCKRNFYWLLAFVHLWINLSGLVWGWTRLNLTVWFQFSELHSRSQDCGVIMFCHEVLNWSGSNLVYIWIDYC